MKTILLVEDDKHLSRGITFSFEKEGFTVFSAETYEAGLDIFNRHNIDLVILDLNLPDGDGLDFCKDIRKKSNIPIIMLTARDMETDEISGLLAGADDYITKPFSISILRARVETVLRRTDGTGKNVIMSGEFSLDINNCKLFRNKSEIPISTTEFRLLKIFMNNMGKVLSKEQIHAELWDNQGEFIDDNTLSVNISRLRYKIEKNPKKPAIIKTIHGIGYAWAKE